MDTHVLVGDANVMNLALVSGNHESLPSLEPVLGTRQRTVDEHQVDIPYMRV